MTPLAAAREALAAASPEWRLLLAAELFGAEVKAAWSSGALLDTRLRPALERELMAIAAVLDAADNVAARRPPRCLPLPDLPPVLRGDRVVAHLPGDENHPIGRQVEGAVLATYPRERSLIIWCGEGGAHQVAERAVIRNLTHDAVAYRPSDPDSDGRPSDEAPPAA